MNAKTARKFLTAVQESGGQWHADAGQDIAARAGVPSGERGRYLDSMFRAGLIQMGLRTDGSARVRISAAGDQWLRDNPVVWVSANFATLFGLILAALTIFAAILTWVIK